MSEHLRISQDAGTLVIAIDRPEKRNALSRQMLADLRGILTTAADSPVSAVVLTGSESLFSAGFDLAELGNGEADVEVDGEIAATAEAIRSLPKPIVAAVEGVCIGAAVEIALACDVRVGSTQTIFSVPAVRLGILYRPGGVADLIAAVGPNTATRLLLMVERIQGESALRTGLLSHLAPPGETLGKSLELVANTSGSVPAALAATKALIRTLVRSSSELAAFEEVRMHLLTSPSRSEAVARARNSLGSRPIEAG